MSKLKCQKRPGDHSINKLLIDFWLQAVIGGQHFGTKSLVMSWYQPPAAGDEASNGEVDQDEQDGAAQDEQQQNPEPDDVEEDLNLDEEAGVSVVIGGDDVSMQVNAQ